jgi:hypothetical protein
MADDAAREDDAGTYETYEGSWSTTSSPGSMVARRARSTASDAPTVTSSSPFGAYATPQRRSIWAARARRSSSVP